MHSIKPYLAGMAVVFIWSGWINISRYGVHTDLQPADITLLRYWTALLVVLPWVVRYRWQRSRLWPYLVVGLGVGFPYTMLSFYALRVLQAAHALQVRRGDVDLVSTPDLRLQLGDRLRVVSPPEHMDAVTALLGDSSRGLTTLAPLALGGGLALGLAIGLIPIPLPGGLTVSIGAAAGTLLVGLVMGRIRRIGPVLTTMPVVSATVLAEIGLMVFLAYAGCKAGSMIGVDIAGNSVWFPSLPSR